MQLHVLRAAGAGTGAAAMAAKPGCDDKEKFIYVTQLKHLEEQLERCHLKYDSLDEQHKDLLCRRLAVEKDSMDLKEYLQHCVVAQQRQVEQLLAQLRRQQQAAAQVRATLQLQYRQQEQLLQEQVDRLSAESRRQALELEQQDEQLMELLRQRPAVSSLEKQMVNQQKTNQAAISSLQHDARAERLRLMKEMRKTLDNAVNPQVPNTREEGAQRSEVPEEFQQLLDKNNALWEQGEVLEETREHLSSRIELLRTNLDDLNQEVSSAREEVEQLRKQLQRKEEEAKSRRLDIERLQKVEDKERLLLASASDECGQRSATLDQLRAELQVEGGRTRQLEGDMQEAATVLEHVLKDAGRFSRRQRARLLELLQSPAPTVGDAAEAGAGQEARTPAPELVRDPLLLMVCYRPGDLGLIPRPTWKHRAAPSGAWPPLVRRRPAPSTGQRRQTRPAHT